MAQYSLALSLVFLGDDRLRLIAGAARRDTEAFDLGAIHGRVSHSVAIRDFNDPLAAASLAVVEGAVYQ